MKAETIRSGNTLPLPFSGEGVDVLSLLRSEVDMLVNEDTQLMKLAAAAALFVSELRGADLPERALNAASTLAKLICDIPEDTMRDALDMLNH